MPKDYNALFKNDPLAFMRKYSCKPASDIEGHLGTQDPTQFTVPDPRNVNDYFYRTMGVGEKIAYLDFQKVHQGVAGPGRMDTIVNHHATGQIEVTGSYAVDNSKVAAYYLPWSAQNIISLTIPVMMMGRVSTPYFFTAAINGCSVFVKGTAQNPTIFHAGGDTGKVDPEAGAKFWRKLMQSHTGTQGEIVGEVNKTDYTVDKVSVGKNSAGVKMVSKLGTSHSRRFESWLKKEVSDDYLVEEVAPTGCVMGVRDNFGDWAFYLQENVTITFYKFNKVKTGLGLSKKVKVAGSMNAVMRPLQVTQIFPGSGHVKFTPTLSRVLKD